MQIKQGQEQDKTSFSKDPEENPAFHSFLKVYAPYCSSDVYSGTRNATYGNKRNFYFHGKHIIDALVKDIIKNKPGIENMKQLVLMGTSAGAYGVATNCDFVADQFHAINKNLDVRCIADAGDFYPPSVTTEGCDPYELAKETHEFWQSKEDQS